MVLNEHGPNWNEDSLAGGIFSFQLNSVSLVTLAHNGDILTIYVFDSKKDRKNTAEQFKNGTQKLNLVAYKLY